MKISLAKLKSLVKESWAVSWPMTLIMFFEFLMGLADVYVAGKINKEIQAAYGLAFQLYFTGLIPVMALTAGVVSVVSKLFSASSHDNAASQTNNIKAQFYENTFSAVISSFVFGIIASIAGFFILPAVINILKVPEAIKDYSRQLVRIYSTGLFFEYFLIVTNGILRSCAKVKISLRNYFVMCALNIILNFVLAFKTPLGFRGIAVATVISVALAAALNSITIRHFLGRRDFSLKSVLNMANIGWPIGLLQILWSLATIAVYLILGNFPSQSVEIIAAYTNGLKIESAIFLPAFAFNLASAVVVGNLLGKGKKKEAFNSGLITAALGMIVIALLSLLAIVNGRYIMPFLSDNATVVREGLIYLYISLLFEPVMAWGVILGGGLAGAGYTKSVLTAVIIGSWLVRVPLCYLFGTTFGLGAAGVWWAMNISIVVQSAFLSRRYFKRMRPVA
jgi:putative MATE family efflux protein